MMDKCKTCGAIGPETPCAYPTEMVQQLQAENARLNNEVVKLREELAAEIKMRNVWQCAYEESREDLAAAQATIERMREKSEAAKNACMVASSGCSHIKTHAECNEARQFAHATKINVETSLSALNEALSVPPNLDALHEAMDKEREECAAICDRFYERGMNPAECAGAIRARKENSHE